jgi:DNA-binding transcriptional LysR family regulator
MKDLNDLYIFSKVVEHNGFTGAARALGVARSSICRRIAHLEEHLSVRLVQRSTRHFAITELGMEFYSHCVKMVADAQAAYEHVACARRKPSGIIRMSCPAEIAQLLISPLIPRFMEKNPEVRIALEATNRKVDLDEKFDLSIRVRQMLTEDSGMVMRSLGIVQQVLVASRGFLERHKVPATPDKLAQVPTLSYGSLQGPHIWKLIDPNNQELQVRHEPKLIADDMVLILQAALQGLGIAQLPLSACVEQVRAGSLDIIFPDYLAPLFEVQMVFPSRRGMLPAVRSFIDFLSAHCTTVAETWNLDRRLRAGRRDNIRALKNRQPQKAGVGESHAASEPAREANVA